MRSTLSSCIAAARLPLAVAAAALCLTGGAHAAADTSRVIVMFKPGAAAAGHAAVASAKGRVVHAIEGMNAIAIEVPLQALKGLERNPNVEYVEEDVKRYPLGGTSPSTGAPYALGQLVPYGHPDGPGRPAAGRLCRQPQGLHHRLGL